MYAVLCWEIAQQQFSACLPGVRPVTIGRRATCDIVIDSPLVATEQAQIFCRRDRFYIRQLSRFVPLCVQNEYELPYRGTVALRDGAFMTVGTVRLEFRAMQVAAAPRKVRCNHCKNLLDVTHENCLWCGTSLAFGELMPLHEFA